MTSRRAARLLALGLLAALIAAMVVADQARADAVHRMPQAKLEHAAAWLATHGGVTGTCKGCATLQMQRLSYELIWRAFPPTARGWAECISAREAGLNPGAISTSDDYSLAQFHRGSWPLNFRRLLVDPAYAVRSFVWVSDHGRRRWPWNGGVYPC